MQHFISGSCSYNNSAIRVQTEETGQQSTEQIYQNKVSHLMKGLNWDFCF